MLRMLWQAWDRFWFSPILPDSVCVFRIFFALIAFIYGALWAPYLLVWFGHHGIESAETVRHYSSAAGLSLLLWLSPNDTTIIAFFIVYMVATVFLLVGLFTRLSSMAVWFLLASFQFRNTLFINVGDELLRSLALLLIFVPAGAKYSIDNLLTKRFEPGLKSVFFDSWIQRIFQFQMAYLYFYCFWSKFTHTTWLNGTVVYYVVHMKDICRLWIPYLFDHMWTIKLLTWGTLLIEFSLWSLIWIKKLRYWVLLVGVIFHMSLDLVLNIPLLQCLTVAMYINFVDPDDVRRVIHHG